MLFVTDLDGTLLRNDLSVSHRTCSVLNSLLDRGELITYATSRSFEKCRELLAGIHFKLPCVVLNGALVVNAENGEVIIANALTESMVDTTLDLGARFNLTPFLLGQVDGRDVLSYSGCENEGQRSFIAKRSEDPRLRKVDRVVPIEQNLVLNFVGADSKLSALRDALTLEFQGQVEIKYAPDIYCDGFFTLEVLHKDADKGTALKQLALLLNVSLNQMAVFGDHLNDHGMFKVAGQSIAVSNAHSELRSVASVVIGSNDEDGVAEYLAALLGDV